MNQRSLTGSRRHLVAPNRDQLAARSTPLTGLVIATCEPRRTEAPRRAEDEIAEGIMRLGRAIERAQG